jgi:Na+-driven multidrug efflux pump
LSIAQSYFSWVAPSYVALGVGIVLGCVMQGTGAPLRALLLDACVVAFVQLPACALILASPDRALPQVWATVVLSYAVLACVFWASYRRGSFLKTALA